METETWKTGGTTDRTFDYAYDTSDRLISIDDSDSFATDFEFAYDDRSQLIPESQLIGLLGTAISYCENWGGTSTLPSSLGSSDLLAAYTFQYDADNRLTQFSSYRDGTSTAYGYDVRDQLTGRMPLASSTSSIQYPLSPANRTETIGSERSLPQMTSASRTSSRYIDS
ncbi:hypothetical protein RISK_005310 [Rhodopirellula islandica]|uniref:Uncharacterized protein n=1 Tax=Rhodopirellula islandica TaxID=595434 RepID=A0A0J1E9V1_RHOIS|nr:hypothetical protein [Rhodopirellula islandica]KLU02244.1 hypothetical protein RISK_005310 [Rhodopirellula islandica]